MLKTFLLLVVLTGSLFLLSGCGPWGHWGGHCHNGSSNNNQNHAHYQGCGHSGYQE